MCSSFGSEASDEAGPVPPPVRSTLVIWTDWKGELYAFCNRECQRHYQAWLCDPDYPFEKATWTDVSFGCIWCGGDLTQGTIWLSDEAPADSKATPPPPE
jgi:hypothetical protein